MKDLRKSITKVYFKKMKRKVSFLNFTVIHEINVLVSNALHTKHEAPILDHQDGHFSIMIQIQISNHVSS